MISVNPIAIEIQERDPEKAYLAVCGRDSYLLESSDGGEKVARYSFIGFNPIAKLTVSNGKVSFDSKDPVLKEIQPEGENPLEILRNIMLKFELNSKPTARFFGGFVGYFSYDLVRSIIDLDENSTIDPEENSTNDLKQPVCEFILAKNNIIFDHKEGKTYLLSHEFSDSDGDEVREELNSISKKIMNFENPPTKENGKPISFESNMSQKEFESNVKAAKEYIKAGDVFQVVLSQRFGTDFDGDHFKVFQCLKKINPSPYMYFLDLGDRKIAGSSPEMLVRVENRKVETYPIAGTRPRGKDAAEDERLAKDLLADEKERAEHLMLVDLGRNDIGRVAEFGSVNVTKFMEIEKYSHVQHIVSEVVGELKPGMDEFHAFESIFPAGTVSGAPKVRAMEIIEELEPTRRGIYAGSVGYFSFNRNLDSAITIRTIEFEGNKAYVQAGAGIVADSVPEREYEETVNKGMALLKALEVEG